MKHTSFVERTLNGALLLATTMPFPSRVAETMNFLCFSPSDPTKTSGKRPKYVPLVIDDFSDFISVTITSISRTVYKMVPVKTIGDQTI